MSAAVSGTHRFRAMGCEIVVGGASFSERAMVEFLNLIAAEPDIADRHPLVLSHRS